MNNSLTDLTIAVRLSDSKISRYSSAGYSNVLQKKGSFGLIHVKVTAIIRLEIDSRNDLQRSVYDLDNIPINFY